MKTSHPVLLLLLSVVFIFIGCSDNKTDAPTPKPEPAPAPAPANAPPSNFDVKVSGITNNSAIISWAKAADPENEKVTYSVVLGGQEVASALDTTNTTISGLAPETKYDGYILAKDPHNNSTRTYFSFTTEDAYIKFSKVYSGHIGGVFSVVETADGGYAFSTSAADHMEVIKVDSLGNKEWSRPFLLSLVNDFGAMHRGITHMSSTRDGGFVIAVNNTVLRLNPDGNLVWEWKIRMDGDFEAVKETAEGGFVAIGAVGYPEDEVARTDVMGRAVLVKLNASGSLEWQKYYGTSLYSLGNDVLETSSGGFILLGSTETSGLSLQRYVETGDVMRIDFWVISTDAKGNVLWEKTYGDSWFDLVSKIKATKDGGYVFAGTTQKDTYRSGILTLKFNEMRIFKIDSKGNEQWSKSYDNGYPFMTNSISLTEDGGYALTGYLQRRYDDLLGLYKLDANGEKEWERQYKIGQGSHGGDVLQTRDGGYMVAGYSNVGLWLLKLNPLGKYE